MKEHGINLMLKPSRAPDKTRLSSSGAAAGTISPPTGKTQRPPKSPAWSDDISVWYHELISPITVIKGYTSTLLQLNSAISSEQQLRYIQGIDSASNRLARLLENLRDIKRLQENGALRCYSISLLDLLRKVLPDIQTQTLKHTIKLHPIAPLPRLKADPERLEQVLVNLIGNAIKYSPSGGPIDVCARFVRNQLEMATFYGGSPVSRTPCYVVSVADTGLGLTPEDLDHLCEKFYRANNNAVRSCPGNGLGLYISRLIVEAHGGHIWAANRPGGGSIFSFSLPVDLPVR